MWIPGKSGHHKLSEVCQIFSGRLTAFQLQFEFGAEGVVGRPSSVTVINIQGRLYLESQFWAG